MTDILNKLEVQEHQRHQTQDSLQISLRRGRSASQLITQAESPRAVASVDERSNHRLHQQKSSYHLHNKDPNVVLIPLNDTQNTTQSSEVSLDDSPTPRCPPEQPTQRTAKFIPNQRRRSRSRSQAINRHNVHPEDFSVIRPLLLPQQATHFSQDVFSDTVPDLLFGNDKSAQNAALIEGDPPFSRSEDEPTQLMTHLSSTTDVTVVKNEQGNISSDIQGAKKITLRSGKTVVKPCFSISQPRTKRIKREPETKMMPKTRVPAKRGASTTAKASAQSKRAKLTPPIFNQQHLSSIS
jgi:hypothetical protein